ncbi:retrovirus-related pol polyprotein from transposon TNT 1-94 [Tanacetum coccineum]
MDMAYRTSWIRCIGVLGYGVLAYWVRRISSLGTVFCTSWVRRIELLGYGVLAKSVLFLIFDQSIIYDVYTDVDTAYSSKSWIRRIGNQNGNNAVQNVGNQVVQNAVQNSGVQNVGNQNGLIVVPGIANQNSNGNGNVVAARVEGNANRNNGNQVRCYNCRGLGHLARNYTVRPRRRDVAYLQTQLLIAQKEEAGIQLQTEEFDLIAAATDIDEIEEVNANCILMAKLQQTSMLGLKAFLKLLLLSFKDSTRGILLLGQQSTLGTHTDKAPVYDSDESAEVQLHDSWYDNYIFNMFTQEEQYTELLEPILKPHQVQQNDSNVIFEISSVEQSGGTVTQHPVTVEETRAYFESLYNNLAIEVEKVNTVNRKLRETNVDLTTELARYKNQEKCFEISQEKYDKLKRCYQKSVYQEQCLTKNINALHLSSGKQITTLNGIIANLNNHLSKEKSPVSFLQKEKKMLKSDFKIREDELLDKKIQLENKIKELDYILKKQSLYNGKVLLEKHDPPAVYDSEETLQLAQESRLKMKQLNKEIKPANYAKINHLSGVFVSQTAKSREELYFLNTSKTANVSKSISIPNEEFLDDTTPSVARKFLNGVKSTIVTLQQADESLVKHKALGLEIERLLRAVVSQDIMSIVQNPSVVDTSNLQTELERKCKDTPCVSNTLDPLSQKLENENVELEFQVRNYEKENAHLKTVYKNLFDSINVTRTQTKTMIDSLQTKLHDTIYENAKLRAQLFDKVSEQKNTTKGTSANTKLAIQSTSGTKLYPVTPFPKSKIIPKTSTEEKTMPNKPTKASVRTKSITISQSHVYTKKDVKSDSNGFSSTRVNIISRTRRPQPRSNKKNDRVLSASKSSCIKNNEVQVEEHHRNLLLSKNKKHMSNECNNIKLDVRNNKSEVVCAMCKQCLITANHDVCVLKYVNGMNSHDLRCSKHMTGNLKLLINFIWKFLGTVRFGNDHVAAILGFGDLQWENILITRVYFVEGLGHNLFSVGQFCNSDLEVAFRRNIYFVRNLKGVDMLKGNRTTNLYTINLFDMAFASLIFLMARITSTKLWLWHQRLSHLNFNTINNLARNDLVIGLPKFKYHKEHFCPSCDQGKIKWASHPPKPVPNSNQRLHLIHMDLCGPMRIASIIGKRYILVIVDHYSRYTWVFFLRSKDEAPEEIKTFLKKITVLLQAPYRIL